MPEDKIINGKALYTPNGAAMEYGLIWARKATTVQRDQDFER